jgi:adenylate cyclase
MSGDAEQEYFADGMVEDVITALSQFKSLFVIARNSSFTYKGKAVDIKQVGRELGVRYVLEGSVRKSGNRVRITGQLIEAATGAHLWGEKIDGALEDVFELQDEVTARVAGAIEPSITQAEINRARVKPTSNLDAYDCYLRALSPYYQLTREGNDAAATYMRHAIELDPGYTLAKAFLAFNHVMRWVQGWARRATSKKAWRWLAKRSLTIPTIPQCCGWPVTRLASGVIMIAHWRYSKRPPVLMSTARRCSTALVGSWFMPALNPTVRFCISNARCG